ncbi:hypothetical protein INR49_020989 [Caranx melampygus]|nr:hypothetical protein INR49_020989 [Caranx melampygus]
MSCHIRREWCYCFWAGGRGPAVKMALSGPGSARCWVTTSDQEVVRSCPCREELTGIWSSGAIRSSDLTEVHNVSVILEKTPVDRENTSWTFMTLTPWSNNQQAAAPLHEQLIKLGQWRSRGGDIRYLWQIHFTNGRCERLCQSNTRTPGLLHRRPPIGLLLSKAQFKLVQ